MAKPSRSSSLPNLRHGALRPVDPASLARMSMTELDELFTELEPATLAELQGRKRGRLLGLAGLDWLPDPIRRAVLGLVGAGGVWRGESIDGEFGTNTWLLGGEGVEFARYLVRESSTVDGGGPVIRLDYDVAANPRPLRGLTGELRCLGPGLFLARLLYTVGGRTVRLSYFTLES